MIEIILESFEEDDEHDVFWYWDCVIGEEFSHTVENIFYMSFLLKEDIITAWIDPESGEVCFVPNYEKLAKSKFDGKYNKGGNGRERNKNRVRCKKDEASVQAADGMLKKAQATFAKLNEKKRESRKNLSKGGNQGLYWWIQKMVTTRCR